MSAGRLKRVRDRGLLLLFPPKCVGCGELMSRDEGERGIFCPICRTHWEQARLPLHAPDEAFSPKGRVLGPVSVVRYEPGNPTGVPQRLIYHIKHKDHARVFAYAAKEMASRILPLTESVGIEAAKMLVTYPPRRVASVRKDGFDQAQRLAKALSSETGWPVERLLTRVAQGAEQKALGQRERRINAEATYGLRARIPSLSGKVVVLVDDLYTTGATLNTCGRLLLDSGAEAVATLTVAKTQRDAP